MALVPPQSRSQRSTLSPNLRLHLLSLAIGIAGGFFGSLVGLGGGVVVIPLLIAFAALTQHQAHATSLVGVVFTGLLGSIAYSSGEAIDWPVVPYIAAAATLLSIASAAFAPRVDAARLKRIFGVVLIVAAILLPLTADLVGAGITGPLRLPGLITLGAVAGVLSGLLGIGGGSLVVPLLVLIFGFDQHTAQGTSLAMMIPAGVAGVIVHLRNRQIALGTVAGLVVGVALGAYLGGGFALYLPERPLQLIFGAVLLWTGLRYVLPKRKKPTASGAA